MKSAQGRLYPHPYVMLTLAPLIWGGNSVAGKLAVGHISPALLTSFRWLGAMLIVLPFALPHLKRQWSDLKPHLPLLLALGVIGFSAFNNIMYLALNHTSAINVGIEQAAIPMLVFIINYLFFRLRTTRRQMIGFGLTLLGVVIVVTNGNPLGVLDQSLNYGDLIMMIAVLLYAVYSAFLIKVPQIHWLNFMAILGFSAFVTSAAFAIFDWHQGNQIAPDLQAMAVVVYIAIFPSIIGQIMWMRGLERLGSNRGGVFINLVPVFSSLFAILLLGESFELFHAISLLLVLLGIGLAQSTAKTR